MHFTVSQLQMANGKSKPCYNYHVTGDRKFTHIVLCIKMQMTNVCNESELELRIGLWLKWYLALGCSSFCQYNGQLYIL